MSELVSDILILPPVRDKKVGSWGYAAGRIRSLEVNLFGKSGLDRLFVANKEQDLRLLMQEHHYPQGEFNSALRDERSAVYQLLQEVAPEDGYRVALLLFSDVHNLKFMLKENLKGENQRSLDEMSHLLLQPSLIDPIRLHELVRGVRDESDGPKWIIPLLNAGEKAYSESYEAAAIDRVLDKMAHKLAAKMAEQLDNDWFSRYFALERDMINLESLLRVTYRSVSETVYRESLLPSGLISEEKWLSLYESEAEEVIRLLAGTPYESLAAYVETYGDSGQAARFARDRDQILIDHIEKGRHVLSGPELTLSYVLAREYEIKNLRIVDAAIRNRLSLEQRNALRRDLW
ncbi:MAG: V-type ATPase subunit [Eubacteriales bacterium]|nr:V-type ATPase subunit [Eubacteriales bacterium]MDD4324414.1 V-type ATPase subunit [Eubacteriales bacterium]